MRGTVNQFTVSGKIYTHSSGRYQLRERKGRNLDYRLYGMKEWQSTGTANMEEASRFVESMISNLGSRPVNTITFKDFADRFFARSDKYSYRKYLEGFGYTYDDEYYETRQAFLDNHIMPQFGKLPIDSISTVQIEMWYMNLKAVGSNRPLSSNTKSKVKMAMATIMDFALKKHAIEENPCDKVHPIKVTYNRRDCMYPEEIAKLFPNDYNEVLRIFGYSEQYTTFADTRSRTWALMWALYFSIMTDTGFRPGEVAAITRSNIIDGKAIFIDSSVDSKTKAIKNSIKTTNRGQKYKVGILSEYTITLLKLYLNTTSSIQLFKVNRGVITTATSNKHFKAALKRAGVPLGGRSQYSIRHYFDTYMLNNIGQGVSELDVQRLMGHTSYRREYDHRTARDLVAQLSGAKSIIDTMRA